MTVYMEDMTIKNKALAVADQTISYIKNLKDPGRTRMSVWFSSGDMCNTTACAAGFVVLGDIAARLKTKEDQKHEFMRISDRMRLTGEVAGDLLGLTDSERKHLFFMEPPNVEDVFVLQQAMLAAQKDIQYIFPHWVAQESYDSFAEYLINSNCVAAFDQFPPKFRQMALIHVFQIFKSNVEAGYDHRISWRPAINRARQEYDNFACRELMSREQPE